MNTDLFKIKLEEYSPTTEYLEKIVQKWDPVFKTINIKKNDILDLAKALDFHSQIILNDTSNFDQPTDFLLDIIKIYLKIETRKLYNIIYLGSPEIDINYPDRLPEDYHKPYKNTLSTFFKKNIKCGNYVISASTLDTLYKSNLKYTLYNELASTIDRQFFSIIDRLAEKNFVFKLENIITSLKEGVKHIKTYSNHDANYIFIGKSYFDTHWEEIVPLIENYNAEINDDTTRVNYIGDITLKYKTPVYVTDYINDIIVGYNSDSIRLYVYNLIHGIIHEDNLYTSLPSSPTPRLITKVSISSRYALTDIGQGVYRSWCKIQ